MALETIDPDAPLAPNVGSTPVSGLGTYSPSVPYKMVSGGKNQLNTITPTAGMLMSPQASGAIKNNMEELLKKYQNPYDEFQSTLDDMVARTQLRPADALRQRAEERQQKEANIYNLKMSMANNEAAQASARNMASAIGLGGAPSGGGVPLAPGVSANAPAGGAQGTMAPTWVDMLKSLPVEQQPIGMAYLQGGDVGSFNKLVAENSMKRPDTQKLWQWAQTQPADVQDMVKGQLFEKGLAPRSYIDPVTRKEIRYSGTGAMPPGTAPAASGAPVVSGTSTLSPSATEFVESRGKTSAVSPAGAEGVMQVMPNTQRDPGFGVTPARDNSPAELKRVGIDYLAALKKNYGDETLGIIAYNMGPGNFEKWLKTTGGDFKKLSPETQSYIGQVHLANSLLNRGGDNIVTRTMGGAPSAGGAPAAAAPSAPVSREDLALQQENLGKSHSAFIDTTYKPLSESVKGQENDVLYADRVLDALKTGNYGPGTSIGQMANQAFQALGLKLSPAEQEQYLRNLTIEQAKQQFVALGAKAAMGSQYTGKESENFAKTLAGINDPKEFIRTVYELKKAKALVDAAHKDFLESSPGDMMKAEKEWKNSGIRERIMKETVTSFNKAPKESEKKTSEAKPKNDRAAMLEWIAKNPNDPRVGTVKKLAGIE